MFNVEDVEQILGGLLERVESNVRDDLQLTVSMSVLAIRQLFEDADEQDVELQMDTSKMEDRAMLNEVDKIATAAPTGKGTCVSRRGGRGGAKPRETEWRGCLLCGADG